MHAILGYDAFIGFMFALASLLETNLPRRAGRHKYIILIYNDETG